MSGWSLTAALSAATEEIWSRHEGPALRIRRGQAVFHEGDPSDAVYVLVEGEVRMFVARPDGSAEQTTLLLRAPAMFGDRDLLAGGPARESAAALLPSRLVIFDREAFLAAWREPAFADRIARDLAVRSALAATTTALQLSPLVHRVAVMLRDRVGQPPPPAEYLAEIAGATAKSITRALTELKKESALKESAERVELDEAILAELEVPEVATMFHSLSG